MTRVLGTLDGVSQQCGSPIDSMDKFAIGQHQEERHDNAQMYRQQSAHCGGAPQGK
jgi:hypothetical protein